MENLSKFRVCDELFWLQIHKNPAGLFNARYCLVSSEDPVIDIVAAIFLGECFRLEAPRFTEFAAFDWARRDAERHILYGWMPPRSELREWS